MDLKLEMSNPYTTFLQDTNPVPMYLFIYPWLWIFYYYIRLLYHLFTGYQTLSINFELWTSPLSHFFIGYKPVCEFWTTRIIKHLCLSFTEYNPIHEYGLTRNIRPSCIFFTGYKPQSMNLYQNLCLFYNFTGYKSLFINLQFFDISDLHVTFLHTI